MSLEKKGLHPRAKALVERLWNVRIIEEAWETASEYLWEEAFKASDLLGGGQEEGLLKEETFTDLSNPIEIDLRLFGGIAAGTREDR